MKRCLAAMGCCGSKQAAVAQPVAVSQTDGRPLKSVVRSEQPKLQHISKEKGEKFGPGRRLGTNLADKTGQGPLGTAAARGGGGEEYELETVVDAGLPAGEAVGAQGLGTRPGPNPGPNPGQADIADTQLTAKEKAARAAEERFTRSQTGNGTLGRKLVADRKKSHKDYAIEAYTNK